MKQSNEEKRMKQTYTCVGEVRGACGISHKTKEAARRHCEQDGRDVKRGHGKAAYSDRIVYLGNGNLVARQTECLRP